MGKKWGARQCKLISFVVKSPGAQSLGGERANAQGEGKFAKKRKTISKPRGNMGY